MHDDVFGEQVDAVTEALDNRNNVAVVSEPFSARDSVIKEAVPDPDTTVSVMSVDEADDVDVPADGVCVVEGTRYLYTRRVDGFAPLERFVEEVAASDAVFVTSWNSYAWSYVRHAADVGVLGEEVQVPNLDAAETARFLASEYDVSEFSDDLDEITTDDTAALRDRLPFDVGRLLEESSDNVFEKISAASDGNPGVARTVFEQRVWDDEHDDIDLSYDDAFALRVVLSKETVGRNVLRSVVDPPSLQTTLRNLSDTGVVEHDGDEVSLRPERLVDTVAYLERRRLVW